MLFLANTDLKNVNNGDYDLSEDKIEQEKKNKKKKKRFLPFLDTSGRQS